MTRAIMALALLGACRSAPPPPEEEPPRFAALTGSGLVIVDGASREPAPNTQNVESFCWAPDGAGFIATTKNELVAIALDGKRTTISAGWLAIRFPAMSPDGKRIAVSGRRKRGEAWGVWLVRTDGNAKPRRLLDGYGPSWSADGSRIYFERYKPNQGLSVVDLGSGEARPFLDDGRRAYTVACARSGRMILFTRGRALTLYEPGKSAVRELTDHRTYNRFPSFSPGERYVIFFRQDPTGETHPERAIVILDLQTETEQILDIAADLAVFAP